MGQSRPYSKGGHRTCQTGEARGATGGYAPVRCGLFGGNLSPLPPGVQPESLQAGRADAASSPSGQWSVLPPWRIMAAPGKPRESSFPGGS